MEMAASADRAWTCGDPWKYVACLPSQHLPNDPFEVSELAVSPVSKGKGKRPPDQEGEKGVPRPPQKKPKKGVCRLHNTASGRMPVWQGVHFSASVHGLWGNRRAWSHFLPSCSWPTSSRPWWSRPPGWASGASSQKVIVHWGENPNQRIYSVEL